MRPDAVKSAVLLREARLRAGLSQDALSKRSGVNRVQLNRYEAGAVAPSLDTLIDLVRACGFDLPLELVPLDTGMDQRLTPFQPLSPEQRLERMLDHPGGGRRLMPHRATSFDPLAIVAALERSYVDYVLIGGLAQVLRGADVVTTGVDICPSFAKGNLARLNDAIGELTARGRGESRVTLDERALTETAAMRMPTDAGELKVIGSPAGVPKGYVDLRRAATREDLGHAARPLVASSGDLAAMAAALDRETDRERLAMLRRIVELEASRQPMAQGSAPSAPRRARTAQRARRATR
jgi:transcriptional regulator with XRE-family HTH domain